MLVHCRIGGRENGCGSNEEAGRRRGSPVLILDKTVEGAEEIVGAGDVVNFRRLEGKALSGGVLEMQNHGSGAGMAGEVVMDFLKVFQ